MLKKATIHKNIPPKTLRTSVMVTAKRLQQFFNQALNKEEFFSNLKNANVTPVSNNKNPLNKENCRPVSVLQIKNIWKFAGKNTAILGKY